MGTPTQLGHGASGYLPEIVEYKGELHPVIRRSGDDSGSAHDYISIKNTGPDTGYQWLDLSSIPSEELSRNVSPTYADLVKRGIVADVLDAQKVRDQDTINYLGRLNSGVLSKLLVEGAGLSEDAASKAVSSIQDNRNSLQADNPDVVNTWRNTVGLDLSPIKNAMFKPNILGDDFGNEALREEWSVGNIPLSKVYQTGFGVRPDDSDGIKQKYGGGYRKYENLQWSPEFGLYDDGSAGQVEEIDTKGKGALVIPLAISMMLGGALSGVIAGEAAAGAGAIAGEAGAGALAAETAAGAGLGEVAGAGLGEVAGAGLGEVAGAGLGDVAGLGAGEAIGTGAELGFGNILPSAIPEQTWLDSAISALKDIGGGINNLIPNVSDNATINGVVRGGIRGALTSAIRGQNPLEGAVVGGVTGGVSPVVSGSLSDMGLTDQAVNRAATGALTSVGSAVMRGGDVGQALSSSLANSVGNYVGVPSEVTNAALTALRGQDVRPAQLRQQGSTVTLPDGRRVVLNG